MLRWRRRREGGTRCEASVQPDRADGGDAAKGESERAATGAARRLFSLPPVLPWAPGGHDNSPAPPYTRAGRPRGISGPEAPSPASALAGARGLYNLAAAAALGGIRQPRLPRPTTLAVCHAGPPPPPPPPLPTMREV